MCQGRNFGIIDALNFSDAHGGFCGFRQAVWPSSRMARKRVFITTTMTKKSVFSFVAVLTTATFTALSALADGVFAVESFTKYDHEASSYSVPATANFVVVKKASSDIVIWTRDELTGAQLTVIESYARAHDKSLKDRNAIFISGTGDHYIDSMYGTVTFAYGDLGLTVTMPRKW